ncbi:hypothetical protein WR25_12226 [Diploscapter pachys]|uniref:ZP domain-containing protein n=1 Tax=Diploscapter pachys TaxID=2018661 RepID=A0A2A2KC41_9BILA|nr:hypothetical protein WR25_12226 [Diploscapter pachys]
MGSKFYEAIKICLISMILPILTASNDLIQDRSVSCSSNTIDISFTFSRPFFGGIFTEKGYSNEACRWRGEGARSVTVKVPLFNNTDCGVLSNETTGSFTVKLIISPVDGLIVDGFAAINARCIYSTQDITLTLPPGATGKGLQVSGYQLDSDIVTGMREGPNLTMQILEGHGIEGKVLSRASVGQRITLDVELKDTAIYDFYVHSCYAHDGSNSPEASINIIDSNGCGVRLARAIDVPVLTSESLNGGSKHVYLHMYGFQFTSNSFVHFECQVKPCVKSCNRQQCELETSSNDNKVPLIPARRRRDDYSLSTMRLQTKIEIQPQKIEKAALEL